MTGLPIDELSTGEELSVQTITYFWQLLTESWQTKFLPTCLLTFIISSSLLEHPESIEPTGSLVKRQMHRWPTGLMKKWWAIREANKDRIIKRLIRKIERRSAPSSRYQFYRR